MEKKRSSKWISSLYVLLLLTINITQVVNITQNSKFNLAFSDILIPIFLIGSLTLLKTKKIQQIFKHVFIWFILLLWILLCGVNALLNDALVNAGLIGIFEELVKTGICIVYFMIGYWTLNEIKFNLFKKSWYLSTLIFIFGGFVIYGLSSRGILNWSSNPNYSSMYMGTDSDPNHAATFLSITFFTFGLFSQFATHKRDKMMNYLMMSLSIVALLFTGSRGGMIGFVMGFVIIVIYYLFKNWKISLALVLIVGILGMTFLLIDQYTMDNYFTKRMIHKLVNIEAGVGERTSLSKVALLMGLDHPIMGIGRGNFSLNSFNYFNKIGVEYIDNIPHNTYFGLFAETGLTGLILFSMPVLLVLFAFYRRYTSKNHSIKNEFSTIVWLIASLAAVGTQAFVLNVENRRLLWYLAGVLLFSLESGISFSSNSVKQKSKDNLSLLLIPLVIIFACLMYALPNKVFIPSDVKSISQSYDYVIPYKDYKAGKLYNVGYALSINQKENDEELVLLHIIEEDTNRNRIILNTYHYKCANGVAIGEFIPQRSDSKIILNFKTIDSQLDQFYVQPLFLHDKSFVYDLTKSYFLRTDETEYKSIRNNKVEYSEWVQKTDLVNGISKTFGELLSVQSIRTSVSDDLSTKVIISIRALKEVKYNVYPLLYGFPNDLHILKDDDISFGGELYKLDNMDQVHYWEDSEIREFVFTIPREYGIYNLKLGLSYVENNETKYLYTNNSEAENEKLLNLGWLNLDEQLED